MRRMPQPSPSRRRCRDFRPVYLPRDLIAAMFAKCPRRIRPFPSHPGERTERFVVRSVHHRSSIGKRCVEREKRKERATTVHSALPRNTRNGTPPKAAATLWNSRLVRVNYRPHARHADEKIREGGRPATRMAVDPPHPLGRQRMVFRSFRSKPGDGHARAVDRQDPGGEAHMFGWK